MASTIKPTGITIARDSNLKFVISWKIGDKDYGEGHQFRYRTWTSEKKHSAWTTSTASSTKKTITLSASSWYPTTSKKLFYFEVEIRGKRKKSGSTSYDWSAWAGKKWKMAVPKQPSLSASLTESNKCKFTWSASVDNKGERPFVNVEYQSLLKKECNKTDGSKQSWKTATSGTGGASSSTTITEDTVLLAKNSYTRWVRVRSRGARGFSSWKYAKHVYARPYTAVINSATATIRSTNTNVRITWTAETSPAHPIDQTTTEYYIGVPGAGMSFPTGQSGTQGSVSKDTSGKDAANYVISDTIGEDECLFVRVITHHDDNKSYSAWKIPDNGAGKLKAPTAMTVTYDNTTHTAAVTALTKGTQVPDAQHAVVYRGSDGQDVIVGIIASNASTLSGIHVPSGTDSPSFGIYAFVGTATETDSTESVKVYAITADMKSDILWQGGTVPSSPADFTASAIGTGEVLLTWSWSWADANKAEISWSTNPYAWESTEEPETYVIDSIRAARWRVSGLETGRTWYFQIRLLQDSNDATIYGPYAEQQSVDLSTAPNTPVLSLSAGVISTGGQLTATWGYTTTDGTQQAYAEICTATVDDTETPPIVYGNEVAHALTAQHVDIDTSDWIAGEIYNLCVRVTSASGVVSGWSDPVAVFVAEPITLTLADISLETLTIDGREVLSLTEMPLTATITGAGVGGTTTLIIERSEDYRMIRPDDSVKDGYAGETIVLYSQTGEDEITITSSELMGLFDDGAPYRLIATIEDGFGQSDSAELDFEVHWTEQAVEPTATAVVVDDVAKITATAGQNTPVGSTVDIYRLSVDTPQIIVQGGAFGTDYVDPYPALGETGGYRCVCITPNGDYITGDDKPAWVDVQDNLFGVETGYIHFNGITIPVQLNVRLSSSWKKDFKETKYLGGTVRGDWNPAVSRTATVNVAVPTEDITSIQSMRQLADWNGICHVRTQDGSSYACDIEVSGSNSYSVAGKVEEYTLNITRIEPEALDGIPYSEWVVE